MRMRLLLAPLVALALAGAPAQAAGAGFVARLYAPNHHPKAGKLWYITVTAKTAAGRPLRAVAWYEYYYNGQKVATAYPTPNNSRDSNGGTRPWPFRGSYRDGILWPARSVGYPLTFRVVVKVKGLGVRNLNWKVVVRR